MSNNSFPLWKVLAGWAGIVFIALVYNAIQAMLGNEVLASWHYVPFIILCAVTLDAKQSEEKETKKEEKKPTGNG